MPAITKESVLKEMQQDYIAKIRMNLDYCNSGATDPHASVSSKLEFKRLAGEQMQKLEVAKSLVAP